MKKERKAPKKKKAAWAKEIKLGLYDLVSKSKLYSSPTWQAGTNEACAQKYFWFHSCNPRQIVLKRIPEVLSLVFSMFDFIKEAMFLEIWKWSRGLDTRRWVSEQYWKWSSLVGSYRNPENEEDTHAVKWRLHENADTYAPVQSRSGLLRWTVCNRKAEGMRRSKVLQACPRDCFPAARRKKKKHKNQHQKVIQSWKFPLG